MSAAERMPEQVDLGRVVETFPLLDVSLPMAAITPDAFTIDDLVTMSEALDVPIGELERLLTKGTPGELGARMRLVQVIAWRFLIRDPHYAGMSWAEARTSLRVEVVRDPVVEDPTPPAPVPLRRDRGSRRSSRSRA